MLDLRQATPSGDLARDDMLAAVNASFGRVIDAVDTARPAPSLERAMEAARRAQAANDPVALDDALRRVVHASIAAQARLRAAFPQIAGGDR